MKNKFYFAVCTSIIIYSQHFSWIWYNNYLLSLCRVLLKIWSLYSRLTVIWSSVLLLAWVGNLFYFLLYDFYFCSVFLMIWWQNRIYFINNFTFQKDVASRNEIECLIRSCITREPPLSTWPFVNSKSLTISWKYLSQLDNIRPVSKCCVAYFVV